MALRIVHVISHPFLPAEDGGRLKTACIATSLARRGDLHWVSLDDHHRSRGMATPPRMVDLPWGGRGTLHSTVHVPGKRLLPRSPWGWVKAAQAGVRFPLSWLPYTARHGEVMAQIARLEPDLVLVDETMLAPFAAFAPATWRVIHTHNHDSALLAAEVFAGKDQGHQRRAVHRLARFERSLFPRVDQVWGVRNEDLTAFGAMGIEGRHLFRVPNVVPPACFDSDPRPGTPGRAVFFGSWWYPPNQEALDRILGLWPHLRERVPDARLAVAGRGLPDGLAARAARIEGIDLLGFVPDLQALMRTSALVVIPLEHGGGTKVKTIEALAAGKPVLATPVAVEGLGLVNGQHAVIRDPGEAFLEALAAMIAAPEEWQDIGLQGQALVRRRFSMDTLFTAVDDALDFLLRS